MSVSSIGGRGAAQVQSLVELRRQLDDLQRQLSTGQKSDTYAGLGVSRGLAMGLRTQLASIGNYGSTIDTISTRLSLAQTALAQIDKSARTVKTSTVASVFTIDQNGQTAEQRAARGQLEQMLDALNAQFGDQYIFSGRSPDKQAVPAAAYILDGDATHAGLKQIMAERSAADQGADGRGRLTVGAPGTLVSLSEDGATPFGLKLTAATSTLSGAVLTAPGGSPAAVSVDFAVAAPNEGDTFKMTLTLPDGTTQDIVLTATTATPPGAGKFSIGGSVAATADNFRSALIGAVEDVAATSLKAASTIAAANDFFNSSGNPPKRVPGPNFATATALSNGTAADTVTWYTGEAGADPARSSATARVDASISVSFGMRADEQALRNAIANVAVFAVASYSASDPQAEAQYNALTQRIATNLSAQQGQQNISDIQAEIANAQTTSRAARDRHTQASGALADMLQSIAGVSTEEVGATILTLQMRLEASLQTTAVLSRVSLVNYLD
jgi:flagellin-like hook-associated protein FlgL